MPASDGCNSFVRPAAVPRTTSSRSDNFQIFLSLTTGIQGDQIRNDLSAHRELRKTLHGSPTLNETASETNVRAPIGGTARRAIRDPEVPIYLVRHLTGALEELSCFVQLEDESAAMYFNIVHGSKLRRKFTTDRHGTPCEDYLLIATEFRTDGSAHERAIALYDLAENDP